MTTRWSINLKGLYGRKFRMKKEFPVTSSLIKVFEVENVDKIVRD